MPPPPPKRARTTESHSEPIAMCRFCLCEGTADDGLISPCGCRGDQRFVHLSCLRRWQRSVLIQQPTHPDLYEEDIRCEVCRVCSQRFVPAPVSREAMYLGFTGSELASLVRPGCLIVTAIEHSEEMSDACLMSERLLTETQLASGSLQPEFETLKHWIGSIMCIVGVDSDGDPLEDGIRAVNLTRPTVLEEEDGESVPLHMLPEFPSLRVYHYSGGPCDPGHATCMGALLATTEEGGELDQLARDSDVHRIGGAHGMVWVAGDVIAVATAVDADRAALHAAQPFPSGASAFFDGADATFAACCDESRRISIFWGYAGWNRSQLHGEFARGAWGCCAAELRDVFPSAAEERAMRSCFPFLGMSEAELDSPLPPHLRAFQRYQPEVAHTARTATRPGTVFYESYPARAGIDEVPASAMARTDGVSPDAFAAYIQIQSAERLVFAAENEMSTVRTLARAAAAAATAAQSDEVRSVAAQLARQQAELRDLVAARRALRDAAADDSAGSARGEGGAAEPPPEGGAAARAEDEAEDAADAAATKT